MSKKIFSESKALYDERLGFEHNQEHELWNRRQFLTTGSILGLGTMLLSGLPVSPIISRQTLSAANMANDNILVLIRMFGGNDGLNMVVPYSESVGGDFYRKNLRPDISLKYGADYNDNHLLTGFGDTDWALPSQMNSIMPLWKEGKMNIIHNVGYPNQDYSHFTSDRNWATASTSDADPTAKSGIMGRYLNYDLPSLDQTSPSVPPALRIGYSNQAIFTSPKQKQLELVFYNADQFYQFAQRGAFHDTSNLGDCAKDQEVAFLRQLTNNSLRYSEKIYQVYNKTKASLTPPNNQGYNNIARELGIVSRLIRGRLGTRIYMLDMNGFDTHENQRNIHPRLMQELAEAVSYFFNDLKTENAESNVTVMTYSEFGRTIRENGSDGTDHGNLSPILMFGDQVKGGFFGQHIVLDDPGLINGSTLVFYEDAKQKPTDFRSVFASVLQNYMCVNEEATDYVLGNNYKRLDLFKSSSCNSIENIGTNPYTVLLGHNPDSLNPLNINIKFSQISGSDVELYIKALDGRVLAKLHDQYTPKGSYTVVIDPVKWNLTKGEYIYQVNSGGKTYSRKFNII
ncbi:MAG TPA: DUF1501 domain-containing protein [Saprospiraceae bacterium]|nr:DUF1501 domain-containing protein [Saprospiraceae bacterium]